jgi:hypothetical protein
VVLVVLLYSRYFSFFILFYAAENSHGLLLVNISPRLIKFQEVDEPLQLDMSELCLSDDFTENNNGKHDIC